jgi:hypothetical protein
LKPESFAALRLQATRFKFQNIYLSFSFVFAAQYFYSIAFLNFQLVLYHIRYITSGAKEIILLNPFSRSSLGIDLNQTLDIIMDSNFSKLDNNGKPIYDERLKALKKFWMESMTRSANNLFT